MIRPSCSQCRRTKRVCFDYRNPSELRFCDQTVSVHVRSRQYHHRQESAGHDVRVVLPPSSNHSNPGFNDGVSAPGQPLRLHNRDRLRKSGGTGGASPLLQIGILSGSIPYDEGERRYFDLFLDSLALDFCGYFETPFWTELIPRECHSEPVVRHATLALSALYKSSSAEFTAPEMHSASEQREHLNVALVQYNRSVRLLREGLSRRESTVSVRLALIACVLFGCFESFYGNLETAVRHISSGLSILEHSRGAKARRQRATFQHCGGIESELIQALERLKLQTISIAAMMPTCEDPFANQEGGIAVEKIPDVFATVDEAFPLGITLAVRCLLHLRRCANSAPEESQSTASLIVSEQAGLSDALEQWNISFHPILSDASRSLTKQSQLGILQLHICITTFVIVVSASTYTEEIIFDKFTGHFREIVALSRRVLEKDQEFRVLRGLKTQFGMGLVLPLFYTSTRCRDPTVRREAITLLDSWPCRNGIWDSWQAARVAEWVASLEEEGCNANGFIPEARRIRLNTLAVCMQHNTISVECMQASVEGEVKARTAKFSRQSRFQITTKSAFGPDPKQAIR